MYTFISDIRFGHEFLHSLTCDLLGLLAAGYFHRFSGGACFYRTAPANERIYYDTEWYAEFMLQSGLS